MNTPRNEAAKGNQRARGKAAPLSAAAPGTASLCVLLSVRPHVVVQVPFVVRVVVERRRERREPNRPEPDPVLPQRAPHLVHGPWGARGAVPLRKRVEPEGAAAGVLRLEGVGQGHRAPAGPGGAGAR